MIKQCIQFLGRTLLKMRYRIEIVGLEKLDLDLIQSDKPAIFLANHPAFVDPVILISHLAPLFKTSPLVKKRLLKNPILAFIFKLVGAIPLPSGKIEKGDFAAFEELKQELGKFLNAGNNLLLYPAGMLKLQNEEYLGAKSLAKDLVAACPEADVYCIRALGLWGSRFSHGVQSGHNKFSQVLPAIWVILKNLIFFVPKRKVRIEIEKAPDTLHKIADKREFNKTLEKVFNRVEDRLNLISYSFWRDDVIPPSEPKLQEKDDFAELDAEAKEVVFSAISSIKSIPLEQIRLDMELSKDLLMDSLDVTNLLLSIDGKSDNDDFATDQFDTVGSVVVLYQKQKLEQPGEKEKPKTTWPVESTRPQPLVPNEKTVPKAFLHVCSIMRDRAAVADSIVGVMTYNEMKVAIIALAEQFGKEFPDESRVGVLLPTSVGQNLVVLALLFAGKVPVMLNWTVGEKALSDARRISGFNRVITSDAFLARVPAQLGEIKNCITSTESIKKKISIKDKLFAKFLSLQGDRAILARYNLVDQDPYHPAVIMFTSGTEAEPKGVPLSHENLISLFQGILVDFKLYSDEVFLSALPAFHSFGFSATGLMPIMAGARAYYCPDPRAGRTIGEAIGQWKATVFICAPLFIQGVLGRTHKSLLSSLRVVISGAEKAPAELVKSVEEKCLCATFCEGYGITECSPVVSVSHADKPRIGVGYPLHNVKIAIVHPETKKQLPDHEEGEICIHGPTVFYGYLGEVEDPFITLDGLVYYKSGDIGKIDPSGSLVITDRIKRFIKIGGEMIPLAGIEKKLHAEIASEGAGIQLALVGDETGDKGKIYGVIGFDEGSERVEFTLEELNQNLRKLGYSNLVQLSKLEHLDHPIPLTGAGKTSYATLDKLFKISNGK